MKTKTFTQNISLCILLLMGCLCYNPAFAQVAITTDGTPPDESAMLDVKSTTSGFLLPRMTEVDIMAITTPANGLIVYNTDDNHFYYFDDAVGGWKEIAIGTGTIVPGFFECGDILVDPRDGQTYTTLQIGTQCWMGENLNYETSDSWWYNNDAANGEVYGRLYSLDAAQTACPIGWHLTTWHELKILTDYLGGDYIAGGKLKEVGYTHWFSPNIGATNSSGFTALPGGWRQGSGSFYMLGYEGNWWLALEDVYPMSFKMVQFNERVTNGIANYTSSYSVRCVKD